MPITTEPSPHNPPAGVARVIFKGSRDNTNWLSGFWLLIEGTPLYSDLAALATDMYAQWQTSFLSIQQAAVHLKECTVRYYDGTSSSEASSFSDHLGGGAATKTGAQDALLISWKTVASHKGGKPRTYIASPTPDGYFDASTFTDTFVNGASTHAQGFLDGVNGLTTTHISAVSLGMLSFFTAGTARNPPVFNAYIAAQAQKRLCTQRRRLGREIF